MTSAQHQKARSQGFGHSAVALTNQYKSYLTKVFTFSKFLGHTADWNEEKDMHTVTLYKFNDTFPKKIQFHVEKNREKQCLSAAMFSGTLALT